MPNAVLPSAVRWVRRRLTLVRTTLLAIVTLLPDLGGDARVAAVRTALATDHALVVLRTRAASVLAALPRPLGFAPPRGSRHARRPKRQHHLGADRGPPAG